MRARAAASVLLVTAITKNSYAEELAVFCRQFPGGLGELRVVVPFRERSKADALLRFETHLGDVVGLPILLLETERRMLTRVFARIALRRRER